MTTTGVTQRFCAGKCQIRESFENQPGRAWPARVPLDQLKAATELTVHMLPALKRLLEGEKKRLSHIART